MGSCCSATRDLTRPAPRLKLGAGSLRREGPLMTVNRLVIPDLAGKAVLITGGSTGIGAAVARGFAGQGARVAIGYHSSADQAHALASEIKAAGGDALAVKGDVADPTACAQIVAETGARF